MNITGVVRVIKGQQFLPDGSTLEEQGITDGSTVNIVIEPDKEINLTMKMGPKEVTLSVSSSLRVRDLKQQLIDGGTVGFPLAEFRLIICADGNVGIAEDISLLKESLPLHLCGVEDNTTLRIIGGSIMIQMVNQRGHHWYKPFPKTITVKDMKKTILSIGSFFTNTQFLTNIWLFVKHGECYHKLESEATIGTKLSNNDIVHCIEDIFFSESQLVSVLFDNKEVWQVGLSVRDMVLGLELRVQEHLGFPVSCLNVKGSSKTKKNESKSLENEDKFEQLRGPHVVYAS